MIYADKAINIHGYPIIVLLKSLEMTIIYADGGEVRVAFNKLVWFLPFNGDNEPMNARTAISRASAIN